MAGKLFELSGIGILHGQYLIRKYFGNGFLAEVEAKIRASEQNHTGELVVAIEAKAPYYGTHDSHERALEVFGLLKVWDTPDNTGILLYISLARHAIEIIADRGIAVDDSLWAGVCEHLARQFKQKNYQSGVLQAIDLIENTLLQTCPLTAESHENVNHLTDKPVVL